MILLAALALACGRAAVAEPTAPPAAPAAARGPGARLPTTALQLGGRTVIVEVADEPSERERGLMFREALAPDTGMLFVYPDARPRSFWMKNTPLPLTIAYLDASGTIVRIADMQPYTTEEVPSVVPAAYALEMAQGWFLAAGVREGDTVPGLPSTARAR
jgi:uncharacterized membrane protein (UPF0127 family)